MLLGLAATDAAAEDQATPSGDVEQPDAIVETTSRGETTVEAAARDWPYPKARASRPLTMSKYMIRGTMSVGVQRAIVDPNTGTWGSGPLVSIDFGGAFSPLDNLEVGVSHYRVAASMPLNGQGIFPIIAAPFGSFGDMPVYVRYGFLRRSYAQMALDFVLTIPSRTNLAVTLGLPVRLRVSNTTTIDTGTEAVVLSNGAGLNVELPFRVTYNPKPAGFLFVDSGFSFQNLARNVTGGSYVDSSLSFPIGTRNQILVPLSVGGGYTFVAKDLVMLDIFARAGWDPFVYINPPNGSEIDVLPLRDAWTLAVGVILHTSPILQQ